MLPHFYGPILCLAFPNFSTPPQSDPSVNGTDLIKNQMRNSFILSFSIIYTDPTGVVCVSLSEFGVDKTTYK